MSKTENTILRVRGYLKPREYNILKDYVKRTGVSESSVVRDAVTEFVNKIPRSPSSKNRV
jgi:hypothetical protein